MISKNTDTPASIVRLILTPECNLNCIYCHNEGFTRRPNGFSTLSMPDFKDILTSLKENGVKSICLTGGEPLIAEEFGTVLEAVTDVFGGQQIHVSTNGILLNEHLELMKDLDIARINVSCDAVDQKRYKQITGSDYFDKVVGNIKKAVDSNFFVNVNCVTLNGINTDEEYIIAMFDFWKEKGVRFSILRLCFAFDGMNAYRYDMNNIIRLCDALGLKKYSTPHANRPPTLCYKYHNLEVALRYYVPNRSNQPCTECGERRMCSEGLYHPRLGLNGVLRSCILREDLSLDLRSSGSFDEPLAEFLGMFDSISETWEPATFESP